MRILQVNVLASAGSTGKITTDIHHTLLSKGYESLVCYGAGADVPEEKGYYRICSNTERHISTLLQRIHGIAYGYYAQKGTKRIINKIQEYKPDVVHLQCINGCIVDIYKLLKFLGVNSIKTVVTLHAEFMYTGMCGHAYDCMKFTEPNGCHHCPLYKKELHSIVDNTHLSWKKMKAAFSFFKPENLILTSVSPWVKSRASMSPIVKGFRNEVVLNGLEQDVFKIVPLSEKVSQAFSKDKKLILFVGAKFNTEKENVKGGWYFVELAKRMPQHQFCIAASTYSDIDNLPSNVQFWGRTNGQKELAELYNRADVTVLTSRRETFSMVTAESLCCGTPIVGFKAGGPESIAIPAYSEFVDQGDLDALCRVVEKFLNIEFNAIAISRKAHTIYAKEVMTAEFIKVYNKLMDKGYEDTRNKQ